MQRAALRSITSICIAFAIGGCGTAHYMLPGRPLEKKEWQFSVVWHYDFNGLTYSARRIFPDVNAYVGVGKNYNLGSGSHFMPWPSHVSVAKYWQEDSDRYWSAYGHIAGGLQNNPSFEFGGTYSNDNGDVRHDISLGLGIGQPPAWSGTGAWLWGDKIPGNVIPVFKYSLVGSDAAISYNHYLFHSSTALKYLQTQVLEHNDTLAYYGPGALVSIDSMQVDTTWVGFGGQIWRFTDSTGNTFTLGRRHWYIAGMPGSRREQLESWFGGRLLVYEDTVGEVIQDLDRLISVWRETGELVITRYSRDILPRIQTARGLFKDISLGVAVYGNSSGK